MLEKIDKAKLTFSAIPGQFTSTLELSKCLVMDFSNTVKENIEANNVGIKNKKPNTLHFTRAGDGPGVLYRYLDEFWDQIPSTHPYTGLYQFIEVLKNR